MTEYTLLVVETTKSGNFRGSVSLLCRYDIVITRTGQILKDRTNVFGTLSAEARNGRTKPTQE